MTSYAYHVETRGADGRRASIWAVAPSISGARALVSAYWDAAGLAADEVMRRAGPIAFDAERALRAGLDIGAGTSGLYCLVKQDQREASAPSRGAPSDRSRVANSAPAATSSVGCSPISSASLPQNQAPKLISP